MKIVCKICESISSSENGNNPFFIQKLNEGYLFLGHSQYYEGYVIYASSAHCNELHELPLQKRSAFLTEMSIISQSIFEAFTPDKINYELLGNTHPHLHWHIIPRYLNQPQSKEPIWRLNPRIRNAQKYCPSPTKIEVLKKKIISRLHINLQS